MDLNELPTLCIPCETLEHLKKLAAALYENEILTDEPIGFRNCPPNILDILNKTDYFVPVEVAGIHAVKGQTEINTNDLL